MIEDNTQSIEEEQNNLLNEDQKVQLQKAVSLNPGEFAFSNDGSYQTKPANSLIGGNVAQRAMSLATRVDIDPIQLVEQAKKLCKQPIKLSWEDVKFEVTINTSKEDRAKDPRLGLKTSKEIVKSVSGFAAPGQATFIMGSSGAGKTSLLNILADRVRVAGNVRLSGNILFNDTIPVNKQSFQKYAAYVMQDDILFATFTVTEALTFAARLKLKTSEEEQNRTVAQIIQELGLGHVANSRIGDTQRKVLSGGERKRASIGVELVSDPSVVLLDEPTSGLDSFKAQSICQLLHNLARSKGKTIVSTIHSPSSEAFFYFDRLILMCDGHIVYQGDAKDSVKYFRMIQRPVPTYSNPADFFMKLLSVNYPLNQEDEDKIKFLNMHYNSILKKSVKATGRLVRIAAPDQKGPDAENHVAPVSIQLKQLMSRSWTLAKREPRLSRAKILQTAIVGFLMIPVFWQLNDFTNFNQVGDTGFFEWQVACQNMAGAIYFMTILQMFLNFQPTVIVFQGEKPVYVRERDSGMYDVWIYATTKLIAELPIMFIVPLLFNFMVYFAIGFTNSMSQFLQFYLILMMMIQAATAMGYCLSSAFNHETTAVAFAPIINMPLNLLGGYMINLSQIFQQQPQRYVAWLMYFSPVRYGFAAMMVTQFPVEENKGTEFILEQYGLTGFTYWGCFAMLFILFVLFRTLVIVSLVLQDRAQGTVGGADTRNTTLPAKISSNQQAVRVRLLQSNAD